MKMFAADYKRYFNLIFAFFCALLIGILYSWSIIKVPLVDEFNWNPTEVAVTFTIAMSFYCVGMLSSGILLKNKSISTILFLSGSLIFLGFVLIASNKGNLFTLYIGFGMLCGFGIGVSYVALLTFVNRSYSHIAGVSSGLIMMGFGLSPLIIGSLLDLMIHSHSINWRKSFLIFAALCFISLTILAKRLTNFQETSANQKNKSANTHVDTQPSKMLKTKAFWLVFINIVFMLAVGNSVLSFARELSISQGFSSLNSSILVGFLSLVNGLARLAFGILLDNSDLKKTMITANVFTLLAPILTLIGIITNTQKLYILSLLLTGLAYGSVPVISSAFVHKQFGQTYYPTNFGIFGLAGIISSQGAIITAEIFRQTGSFKSSYFVLILFALISTLFNFLYINYQKPNI